MGPSPLQLPQLLLRGSAIHSSLLQLPQRLLLGSAIHSSLLQLSQLLLRGSAIHSSLDSHMYMLHPAPCTLQLPRRGSAIGAAKMSTLHPHPTTTATRKCDGGRQNEHAAPFLLRICATPPTRNANSGNP